MRQLNYDGRRGWRARIEEVTSSRRPMSLSPNIRPSHLIGMNFLKGRVRVYWEESPEGERSLKRYELIFVKGGGPTRDDVPD